MRRRREGWRSRRRWEGRREGKREGRRKGEGLWGARATELVRWLSFGVADTRRKVLVKRRLVVGLLQLQDRFSASQCLCRVWECLWNEGRSSCLWCPLLTDVEERRHHAIVPQGVGNDLPAHENGLERQVLDHSTASSQGVCLFKRLERPGGDKHG